MPTEHLLFSREDYYGYFGIEEEQMKQCEGKQVVTVHHDEHGKIVKLSKTSL
jgi:poly-beta-1,6-N-acetyl-D-glucosamine biosynthesis protein PgaD